MLLTEISIKDKFQKETQSNKNKLPFDVFEKLCYLDPTTQDEKVGKYTNWILAKYQPNSNLDLLHDALVSYHDKVKRGIAQRYNINPNINAFKSYNEFIDTIKSFDDSNDTSISNSEYNNRKKLQGQFEIIGSTSEFDIIKPLTWEAERYFGSHTTWCTVANIHFFNGYMYKGSLYIIYPKNGDYTKKMQFFFQSDLKYVEFANYNNNHYQSGFDCIESLVYDENEVISLLSLCKKIFGKRYFLNRVEALQIMTDIPKDHFRGLNIKKIVIPNHITEIGEYAFRDCKYLTSVTIPNSVTSIGKYAFEGCSSLTSVIIPNSVTTIKAWTFLECDSLTSITIPSSVNSIGSHAFSLCNSLTSITIPNSVTLMAYDAFHFCENLKKVIAPSRFTEYFKDNLGIDIIPNDMEDTNAQPNNMQSNVIESKQIIHLSMTDLKQMVMETIEKLYQK